MDLLDSDLVLLERMQDVAALRHRLMASDLANAEVPGFKGFEVRFEEELARALARGEDPSGVRARLVERREKPALEESMGDMARNTLLFRTWTRLLSIRLKGLRAAIGGR